MKLVADFILVSGFVINPSAGNHPDAFQKQELPPNILTKLKP